MFFSGMEAAPENSSQQLGQVVPVGLLHHR